MENFFQDTQGSYFNQKSLPSKVDGGWIYIIMTSQNYHRVKIGKTKNNPIDRLATLRCGDPYLAMTGAFFIPESFAKVNDVEKWLHEWFRDYRIRFAEHIRPHGNRPAHTLDADTPSTFSEWFKMDESDAKNNLAIALMECLEVDEIQLADCYCLGDYPTKLAFYTQEMLSEMYGNPRNVDDDYEGEDAFDNFSIR